MLTPAEALIPLPAARLFTNDRLSVAVWPRGGFTSLALLLIGGINRDVMTEPARRARLMRASNYQKLYLMSDAARVARRRISRGRHDADR